MTEPERMTLAVYQAQIAKPEKRHKYGATRTQFNGIWFDSKKEAGRYAVLLQQERAGLIKDLELQPRYPISCGGVPAKIRSKGFPMGRRTFIYLDFRYFDIKENCTVVEDTKGKDTAMSRLKRALLEAEHGVIVKVI